MDQKRVKIMCEWALRFGREHEIAASHYFLPCIAGYRPVAVCRGCLNRYAGQDAYEKASKAEYVAALAVDPRTLGYAS